MERIDLANKCAEEVDDIDKQGKDAVSHLTLAARLIIDVARHFSLDEPTPLDPPLGFERSADQNRKDSRAKTTGKLSTAHGWC